MTAIEATRSAGRRRCPLAGPARAAAFAALAASIVLAALAQGCGGGDDADGEGAAAAGSAGPEETTFPGGIRVRALEDHELPLPTQRVQWESLSDALKNADFDFAAIHDVQGPERALSEAMRLVFTPERQAALDAMGSIARGAPDPGVANVAGWIYQNLLMNAGLYADLRATLGDACPPMIRALAEAPPQTVSFVNETYDATLVFDAIGIPEVTVGIDGEPQRVAIDTGAAISLLTADTAARLGVEPLPGMGFSLGTSTEKEVSSGIGVIERLEVGRAVFENHPVLIVQDAMEFRTPDGGTTTIEGLLGWNAIREARFVLDYGMGTFDVAAPGSGDASCSTPNLFWAGYPMFEVLAADGQRLLFGLATGSRKTTVTHNIFAKVLLEKFGRVTQGTMPVMTAGGVEQMETEVVERVELVIGRHLYTLPNVARQNPADDAVVWRDGTLASDLASVGRVTIDFPTACFRLDPRI